MLLSLAPALVDSSRCTSFAVHVVRCLGGRRLNCTAAMPTPRATRFSRLEEPFPDDEPTSDAPCRSPGTAASAPCTDRWLL